jgi:S1-C subfamily serine protease
MAMIGAVKVGRFSDTTPAWTDQDGHWRPLNTILDKHTSSSAPAVVSPTSSAATAQDDIASSPATKIPEKKKADFTWLYVGGFVILLVAFIAIFPLSKSSTKSRSLINTKQLNNKELNNKELGNEEPNNKEFNNEELYAKVEPCCVRIRSKTKGSNGHGSGFFFKEGGYILTNNHVIDNGIIEVVTNEGVTYKGKVLAQSKKHDLAVIKINIVNHDVLPLGSSETVKIGSPVALIGYPRLDMDTATMNSGMVSNTDRTVYNIPCYQLDVTVNRGNSGGPVILKNGHVIGILTFKERDPDVDRFNFAVRIDVIRDFLSRELNFSFPET